MSTKRSRKAPNNVCGGENGTLNETEFLILELLFGAGFFLTGLFYQAFAFLWGAAAVAFLLYTCFKKGKLVLFGGINNWCLLAIVGMFLLSVIWGADRGMSALGFVRSLVWLIGGVLLFQLSHGQRQRLRAHIPYLMCAVLLLGIPAFFIEPLGQYFLADGGRYGSFIQYPNTLAILCLCSLVILLSQTGRRWYHYAMMAVLLLGILLTGSRIVFVLLVLTAVFYLIYFKPLRRILLIGIALCAVGLGIYLALTRDLGVIGRFLTMFSSNNSLLCRFLYAKDAVSMLAAHPLGVGDYGYASMQGLYATGVYTVRFVHNDVLQLALDAGIGAAVLFLIPVFRTLFARGFDMTGKLLTALLLAHSLLDFDLQYPVVVFVLLLNLDLYRGRVLQLRRADRRGLGAIAAALGVICLYFGFAIGIGETKSVQGAALSLKLYPFQTELLQGQMNATSEVVQAQALAARILKLNPYARNAWRIMGIVSYHNGDYDGALEQYLQAIRCAPYDADNYKQLVIVASAGIKEASDAGDNDAMRRWMEAVETAAQLRRETLEKTSTIGWRLEHQPQLTLDAESEQYIADVCDGLRAADNSPAAAGD